MPLSLLEGTLKAKIAAGFKGRLTKGTLRRNTSTTVDGKGDIVPATPLTFTFEGVRQSFTAYYKAQSGIADTDVGILFILGSFKPDTIPQQEDLVYLKAPWNAWYKIRRILEIDPAGASCRALAYPVPAP